MLAAGEPHAGSTASSTGQHCRNPGPGIATALRAGYSGPMDEHLQDLTLDQLRAELNNPKQDGPTWTTEEAQLSTPYSEREMWERILMWDLLDGKARFQGPPGLRDEMAKLLAATTTDEIKNRLERGQRLNGKAG